MQKINKPSSMTQPYVNQSTTGLRSRGPLILSSEYRTSSRLEDFDLSVNTPKMSLKQKLAKWLAPELVGSPMEDTKSSRTPAIDTDADMTFKLIPARGGVIVEVRWHDDIQYNTEIHVIPDNENVGESVASIINFMLVKL